MLVFLSAASGVDMSKVRDVVIIVGSLRKASLNRKLAHALIEIAPAGLKLEIVAIGDLALFNQELDEDPSRLPAPYTAFRERMRRADGVIFVTPEYNRSVPGVLKNALDVGSRPHGKSVWGGKPAAVLSASPGAIGGFGANHHLRQSLVFLDMPAMPQPEAYLGHADELFDESGNLVKDSTRDFLGKVMRSYAAWLDANARA